MLAIEKDVISELREMLKNTSKTFQRDAVKKEIM